MITMITRSVLLAVLLVLLPSFQLGPFPFPSSSFSFATSSSSHSLRSEHKHEHDGDGDGAIKKDDGSEFLIAVEKEFESATSKLNGRADVVIPFQLTATIQGGLALDQLSVCIQLEGTNGVLVPYHCIDALLHTQMHFTLSNMAAGSYKVSMKLSPSNSLSTILFERSAHLEVRDPVEFTPSYAWQPLHPWHTIPYGLETRLPIGEGVYGTRKEARIPSTWRLQVMMPKPCKYFLRLDVYQSLTLQTIIKQATHQCRRQEIPESCFKLVDKTTGQTLLSMESVESSGLFGLRLVLLNTCG